MSRDINVAILGTRFMGRAHSHAFLDVVNFFDVPLRPVLRAACGRDAARLAAFARQFGWQTTETEWQRLVPRGELENTGIRATLALY